MLLLPPPLTLMERKGTDAMNPKKLFLETLDDLHLSINSGDEYKVLRASVLIRQLVVDGGNSLVTQINRKHKLRLKYRVIQPNFSSIDGIPEPDLWCTTDGIDPRRSTSIDRVTILNEKSFLGLCIGQGGGQAYSVKEIIKFSANTAGGVHSDSPRSDIDLVLDKLRKLYIFSDISILFQHLRSIGRILLEGLRPLRNKVLNLERFQDSPGLSLHMALTLFPIGEERELCILDIGTEEQKNRLSIHLDTHQDLCFRMIDSSGQAKFVRAGSHDCAFNYGKPCYLSFQVAFCGEELLLHLNTGGWSMVNIFSKKQISLDSDKFHFVLGSDVIGKAQSHMSIMEWCSYSRYLKEQESEKIKSYFEDKIQGGYKGAVFFKGNKFLYSKDHPNFMQRQ